MHSSKILLSIAAVLIISTLLIAKVIAQNSIADLFIVNPNGLYDPTPFGYSHAVVAKNATHIAYIAGQGGEDSSGTLSPSFDAQVNQAYKNLLTALSAVNASPDQVTKITTYVVGYDMAKLEIMAHYAQKTFGDSLPAQTLVPVPRLALDGMLFEVDAITVLD